MNNGKVSLKDHIEALFREFKERYVSERYADLRAFEEFKKTLDEKTKLQAGEYERRLTAYPTIKDFNDLKEKVTVEFSVELGKNKALIYIISVSGAMVSLALGLLAYFK